ncbi:hypothetical protein [Actibacterium sp. XHP0104]|uniref:hypothetical protein n=1 Tax=Actibacterium sp. XHP0104 TaxID=2984335 RepID=UPI0021E79F6B|nr:hypothetical protein [Actibacterium sp. XHP0104]MCV2881509.1 hypothetical protein [Actibacterium sp. XHP0104]
MAALMLDVVIGGGIALLVWIVTEQILFLILPRLERLLPDDIVGPDGWFSDTANKTGIFDFPLRRRQG